MTSIARKCALAIHSAGPALGLLSFPCAASAESAATSKIVFVLHDESPALGVLRTFDSVRGQLGELEIDILAAQLPRLEGLPAQARQAAEIAWETHADAAFWFEVVEGDGLRIYALHAPSGRVFARDVSLGDEASVQREQLAVVLRAAVPAALGGGSELGAPLLVVPRVLPPERTPSRRVSSPSPEPADPPAWPIRVHAAVGYAGTTLARDASWQSGVSAELVADGAGSPRVSLGAGYAMPATIAGDGANANITRVPLFARLGTTWSTGRSVIGVEAGPIVEAWHRRTSISSDTLRPTEAGTVWRYGGILTTRAELGLGSGVGLYLLVEAQWFPAPHQLTIQSEVGEQSFTTYSLRPQVGLGITFDVLRKFLPPQARPDTDEEKNR